jgi:hypothetical protein
METTASDKLPKELITASEFAAILGVTKTYPLSAQGEAGNSAAVEDFQRHRALADEGRARLLGSTRIEVGHCKIGDLRALGRLVAPRSRPRRGRLP